jgi:DNA-directed RNA polymerase specialized sigma24 family protein
MDRVAAVLDVREGVEAVYRADAERLWRALYAYAGDPELASDAVAEAYSQVIHRGAAVRDPAAWVWRTAFRIAAGALKTRRTDDFQGHGTGRRPRARRRWDGRRRRDVICGALRRGTVIEGRGGFAECRTLVTRPHPRYRSQT